MPKKATITPVRRRIYGKPWSKISHLPVTPEILDRIGEVLLASVIREGKKDFAKQRRMRTPRGEPMGLPVSPKFWESFGYKIIGKSTVAITTTWEWWPRYEGRRPFKMTWVTRQMGVDVIPISQSDGTVIFRTTPLTTDKAWIHPGVARYTFLQRGVRKGRMEAAKILIEEFKELLRNSPMQ